MSPAQESVFSILQSIAENHDSFTSLKQDRRFQVWLKHSGNKRRASSYFKNHFDEIEQEKLAAQASIPMYF